MDGRGYFPCHYWLSDYFNPYHWLSLPDGAWGDITITEVVPLDLPPVITVIDESLVITEVEDTGVICDVYSAGLNLQDC